MPRLPSGPGPDPAGGCRAQRAAAKAGIDGIKRRHGASGFAHNRCLVPADAYYEWQAAPDGKHPFAFAQRDGTPMMFAGILDIWQGEEGAKLRSFAILTTRSVSR